MRQFKITGTIEPDTHFGTIYDFASEVLLTFGDECGAMIRWNGTTTVVKKGDTPYALVNRWFAARNQTTNDNERE